MSAADLPPVIDESRRLTQDDWCNDPQPWNWRNACMRQPGHDGAHAVRKHYRLDECWHWPGQRGPVGSTFAYRFGDLWHPDHDLAADLPPVGARVRAGVEAVVVSRVDKTGDGDRVIGGPFAYIRWDCGGGTWVTADEIEEVLSDG